MARRAAAPSAFRTESVTKHSVHMTEKKRRQRERASCVRVRAPVGPSRDISVSSRPRALSPRPKGSAPRGAPYSNAPRGHPRVAEGPRDRGHREGARVPSTLLPHRARSLTPANARGPSADPKVHARDIFHSRVASRGADRPFLRLAFSTPSQARASPVSAASLALTFPQVTRGRAAPGPGAPFARRCRCRPSRERSAPSRLTLPPPPPRAAATEPSAASQVAPPRRRHPIVGVGSPPSPRS